MNKILIGNDARQKLMDGISKVHSVVAPTLGANGRNAVYNKWSRVPIVTNDGVSIAREIEPEDLGELQGANLVKQVSERTNDEAGDGTTTSIVLAYSMLEQGVALLADPSRKVNPMRLRRQIMSAADRAIALLKDSAKPISTLEELEQVANISVESPEMGKTIAKAIFDAGDHGIVYVNDSDEIGVSVEKVEGYKFAKGLEHPLLCTNMEKLETVLENPAIILTDIQVQMTKEFMEFLGVIAQKTRDILLVCDEYHPDVLRFAVKNLSEGKLKLMIVKKPMAADSLEDIASLTSAYAMTNGKGISKYSVEYLGGASKIICKKDSVTIIGGNGAMGSRILSSGASVPSASEYVDALKKQLDDAGEVAHAKVSERIAALTGGVYMLNVGDKTEAEAKYLRMKVDDAVNAVKAAREEGIVAGGGMALYNIAYKLHLESADDGMEIVMSACRSPFLQIIANGGDSAPDITAQFEGPSYGYDAKEMAVVPDMIAAGIIDPVKVTRNALSNAASFASLLLTTESLIVPLPEKDSAVRE